MRLKIPFTIYAKIVPDREHNKRRTYTKSMEKIAKYVANDINNYIKSNPDRMNINVQRSVSVTPQFAQRPARVTITGWDLREVDNFQPASMVSYDASYTIDGDDNYDGTPGKVVKGYRATERLSAQGQTIDSNVITWMRELKSTLESISPYLNAIYRIDYMGIVFGETGYSF